MAQFTTQSHGGAAMPHGLTDCGITRQTAANPLMFVALLTEMMPSESASTGRESLAPESVQDEADKGAAAGTCRSCFSLTTGPGENDKGDDSDQSGPAMSQITQMLAAAGHLHEARVYPPEGDMGRDNGNGAEAQDSPDMGAGMSDPPIPTLPKARIGAVPAESAESAGPSAVPIQPLTGGMTVLPTWRAETVSRPSVEWFQPQSETSSHLPKIDSWPAEGKTAWTDRLEGSLQPNAGISVRNDGGEGTCDPELPQSTLEPQKQAVPQFLHIDAAESAGKLCQPGLNALQSRQDGALTTERPVQATTAMAVPQAQDNQDPAAEPAQSKGEQINASTYAASEQQKLVASVPLQSFQVASVQEEREASPRTDGGIPDIAAVMRMEPVSAKTSPKKESEGSKDEGEPGAKEKEIVRLTWPGATTQRTFALPEQSRQELQSKSGEPENALHESILSQVREGVVSHDGKGNGRMTVRLNPSELGELQVHVRVDDQRVKVEIIAGSRTVREALMGNLDMLKETLLKQNLNMERFDVSSGRGNGFSQSFGAERERVRQPARTPVVLGAVQPDIPEEREGYDWGSAQSSMVDVRL